jgi:prepilin-type N-terminal cleavage/methylation domain-containing protein
LKRRSRGFSLVELMISLVLFGLIASGALSLVMSGARTQAHSARVDVAQSGLRAGLDFITRDILSASAGAKSGTIVLAASGANLLPVIVTDGGTNNPDTLEIYSIDARYMGTVTGTSSGAGTVAVGAVDLSIALNDTNYPFAANDLVQLSDLNFATLVQLSGATATLLTGNVTNVPLPITGFTGTYNFPGTYVFKSRHVKYSIGNPYVSAATGNGSALMMDIFDGNGPQPLAEGVEDLQVALSYDILPTDGVIGPESGVSGDDDEWVFNNAADTAPTSVTNLKSVRVTLVAKSSAVENGSFPVRPAAEDHVGAAASDGFFRRVIRSEVAVRSLNI